jgi:hypothetical protein
VNIQTSIEYKQDKFEMENFLIDLDDIEMPTEDEKIDEVR